MAEIKGILINAWIDFLKKRYGEQAVSQSLDALEVEDRLALASTFLASSWYPYSTLHALRRLSRPLATASDQNLSVEIGRFMAEYVFTGVYRSFLVKDPIKQVEKFSWIGDFFFHEARRLETEIVNETQCLVRYRYEAGANPTRAICESLGGFWSKTLELAGASNVRSTHPKCIAEGGGCCEFKFEWNAPRPGHA
ncbi:MAG TPA: hypothetical protein VIG62_22285 [Blastocatellia bacterium]|jgi:hypothetical protein